MKQQITGEQRKAANPIKEKILAEAQNVRQLQTLRTHLETCMKVINEEGLTYDGKAQEVSFYREAPRTTPFDTIPGSPKTAAYATLRMHARGRDGGSPYSTIGHDSMVSFLAFDGELYIADRETTQAPHCQNARIMCIYTPTRRPEGSMDTGSYVSHLQPLHKGSMEDAPFTIADSLAESLVRPAWGEERALKVKLLMINAMTATAGPSANASGPAAASGTASIGAGQNQRQLTTGEGPGPKTR